MPVPHPPEQVPTPPLSPSPLGAQDLAQRALQDLELSGLLRLRRVAQTPTSSAQRFGPEHFTTFCSNDYLGLASDPRITQALIDGARLWGVGSGASHLISGHTQAHEDLEARLAAWQSPHIPDAQALLFANGYAANVSLMGALTSLARFAPAPELQATDRIRTGTPSIYSARLNHASIIDGIRLAKQQGPLQLQVFDTEDLGPLERGLAADTSALKIIVSDTLFSMDGHLAPVHALLELAERFDALLVLDDAHGFGVLGELGHGALEHLQVRSHRIVYMGTLGKAAGVSGAFVCASAALTQWIFQKSRPYIYSTASPAAMAHATLQSLTLIEGAEGQQRRAHLHALIECWRSQAQFKRWQRLPSWSPIQPLIVGSNGHALSASASLQAAGFLTVAIRPPTVAAGTARLRITFCAQHTLDDVARLVTALQRAESQLLSGAP